MTRLWRATWVPALLGATVMVSAVGCGGTTNSRCGPGTTLSREGVCVVSADAGEPPPFAACGPGTIADGSRCVLAPGSGGAPMSIPSTGGVVGDSSASPPPHDDTPPFFAGATFAETASDEAVLVSWNLAVDDVTPRSRIVYEIAWGDKKGFSPDWTSATTSAPGAVNAIVHGLPHSLTPYFFVARAVDEAGNADDNGREVTAATAADTTPPNFEGCKGVTDVSYETVSVEWDPATDNGTGAKDITYEIWVRPLGTLGDSRDSFPTKTVVGALSVTLDGLSADTRYAILCGAKDASGNRDTQQNFVSAKTLVDGTPPGFTGIATAAPGVAQGTAELTWTTATDNGTASGEIVYVVYASNQSGQFDFSTPLMVTGPGVTSATATGLARRTKHYFVVRARDHSGNEDSNTAEASAHLVTSFSLDVQPIFDQTCAILVCHTKGVDGTNPPIQGMDMDPGAAYTNIVNVVAREGAQITPPEPSIKRIDGTSTNPMDSYLWRKIQKPALTNIVGHAEINPQIVPIPLTPDQIQIITDWITEGSHDN